MVNETHQTQPRGLRRQGLVEGRQRKPVDHDERPVGKRRERGLGRFTGQLIGHREPARQFNHLDRTAAGSQRIDQPPVEEIAARQLIDRSGDDEMKRLQDRRSCEAQSGLS